MAILRRQQCRNIRHDDQDRNIISGLCLCTSKTATTNLSKCLYDHAFLYHFFGEKESERDRGLTRLLPDSDLTFADCFPLHLERLKSLVQPLHQLHWKELKHQVSKSASTQQMTNKLNPHRYMKQICLLFLILTFIVLSIPLVATTQSNG